MRNEPGGSAPEESVDLQIEYGKPYPNDPNKGVVQYLCPYGDCIHSWDRVIPPGVSNFMRFDDDPFPEGSIILPDLSVSCSYLCPTCCRWTKVIFGWRFDPWYPEIKARHGSPSDSLEVRFVKWMGRRLDFLPDVGNAVGWISLWLVLSVGFAFGVPALVSAFSGDEEPVGEVVPAEEANRAAAALMKLRR